MNKRVFWTGCDQCCNKLRNREHVGMNAFFGNASRDNNVRQVSNGNAGRILTPRNPPSHQHQKLSTQISQDHNLPTVEKTSRNHNSDANNSKNSLAVAIAGIASQQRPKPTAMLKPVSTNILFFGGRNKEFELFEDLFHTMLKIQPK